MRFLTFVVLLLLVGIAGLGYYRGWFRVAMNNADHQPSATITVNKDKIHDDEQKARDEMHRFGQGAKEKIADRTGKVKEPERQP